LSSTFESRDGPFDRRLVVRDDESDRPVQHSAGLVDLLLGDSDRLESRAGPRRVVAGHAGEEPDLDRVARRPLRCRSLRARVRRLFFVVSAAAGGDRDHEDSDEQEEKAPSDHQRPSLVVNRDCRPKLSPPPIEATETAGRVNLVWSRS